MSAFNNKFTKEELPVPIWEKSKSKSMFWDYFHNFYPVDYFLIKWVILMISILSFWCLIDSFQFLFWSFFSISNVLELECYPNVNKKKTCLGTAQKRKKEKSSHSRTCKNNLFKCQVIVLAAASEWRQMPPVIPAAQVRVH